MRELPFRVIVTNGDGHTSLVVRLPRAPDIGEALELPQGMTVRVWRVLSADENSVSGVILADAEN